jgi:hypothetical protein
MSDRDINARLEALEAAIVLLREELAEARSPQIRSMKMTRRCPSCGGRTLLHFKKLKDMWSAGAATISLQKLNQGATPYHTGGMLEAFACHTCKLVELDAVSLDDIVSDVDVEVLVGSDDTEPGRGPFR